MDVYGGKVREEMVWFWKPGGAWRCDGNEWGVYARERFGYGLIILWRLGSGSDCCWGVLEEGMSLPCAVFAN